MLLVYQRDARGFMPVKRVKKDFEDYKLGWERVPLCFSKGGSVCVDRVSVHCGGQPKGFWPIDVYVSYFI